jgi:colanic acid biosynthesis glycosyl transferase WcaI
MRILILTQVFYPDTVSVSQHFTDMAEFFTENGHIVHIYTSCYPYENKKEKFNKYQLHKGIEIFRLNQSSFGKNKIIYRLIDFFTFYMSITLKLLRIKRKDYDVIIGTTIPPMLSFIGQIIASWKKIKFVYWVMDLQPELAIESGLINKNSISAKVLTQIGNRVIKRSDRVISLDRFMTKYLVSKGADQKNIDTIPVWPVIEKIYNGDRLNNPFRKENNFGDKIVVMYSGNHAFVHPLDTLLNTALLLKDDAKYLFVFIGGGVRKKDVTEFKVRNKLKNIIQLPFQPRENIHNSLGSSDIQVVILGDGQVGYTHPNKIYGALYVGKPILYVGPSDSHVTDIINDLEGSISVRHGESNLLVDKLEILFSKTWSELDEIGSKHRELAIKHFSPQKLKQDMLDSISK